MSTRAPLFWNSVWHWKSIQCLMHLWVEWCKNFKNKSIITAVTLDDSNTNNTDFMLYWAFASYAPTHPSRDCFGNRKPYTSFFLWQNKTNMYPSHFIATDVLYWLYALKRNMTFVNWERFVLMTMACQNK